MTFGIDKKQQNLGLISLILAITALILAPLLSFIPIIGFALPIMALCGIVIGFKARRCSESHSSLIPIAITLSALVFIATSLITTWWNLSIVVPAIGDFTELQEVLRS